MMVGRDASRDGNGRRGAGDREIVERDLGNFEGSRWALRLRGFDPAIAQAVEVSTRHRRRTLHAVVRVVSGRVGRVDAGQCAGAHGTGPSHCNGEGGCDDWLPIAHMEARIRLSRAVVKLPRAQSVDCRRGGTRPSGVYDVVNDPPEW